MVNIPREKVKEGMYLVKRNVLDLVDVARIIIREDSTELYLRYAYGIIQIAIEELGKGLILKEGYINCHSSVIDIENWVFGRGKKRKSHTFKFEKAWEILNEDLKIVHNGIYDKEVFDPSIFDTDIEACNRGQVVWRSGKYHLAKSSERPICSGLEKSNLLNLYWRLERGIPSRLAALARLPPHLSTAQ